MLTFINTKLVNQHTHLLGWDSSILIAANHYIGFKRIHRVRIHKWLSPCLWDYRSDIPTYFLLDRVTLWREYFYFHCPHQHRLDWQRHVGFYPNFVGLLFFISKHSQVESCLRLLCQDLRKHPLRAVKYCCPRWRHSFLLSQCCNLSLFPSFEGIL